MNPVFVLILLGLFFVPVTASARDFVPWMQALEQEAIARGISPEVFSAALSGFQPIEKVMQLDVKQPEKKKTFAQYRSGVISEARIRKGRQMMQQHAALLKQVEAVYGVPPKYVVALWGIETSFGAVTGGYDVPKALATLAWEGRREAFFKEELMQALGIIQAGHITASAMKGSWAGAMGQNQFMPSSFNKFAVDFNGDGRRDIWRTEADVFASTSNYLKESGWSKGQRWGREVKAPAGLPLGRETVKKLSEWARAGVTLPNGAPLPLTDDIMASLVAPDGVTGPHFLVYNNYSVFMKWNRSTYFALSVGLLADRLD